MVCSNDEWNIIYIYIHVQAMIGMINIWPLICLIGMEQYKF